MGTHTNGQLYLPIQDPNTASKPSEYMTGSHCKSASLNSSTAEDGIPVAAGDEAANGAVLDAEAGLQETGTGAEDDAAESRYGGFNIASLERVDLEERVV